MAPPTPPPHPAGAPAAARLRSPRPRRRCRTPPPRRPRPRRARRPRGTASAPRHPPRPSRQMPGGRSAREEGQEPDLLGGDRLLRLPAARRPARRRHRRRRIHGHEGRGRRRPRVARARAAGPDRAGRGRDDRGLQDRGPPRRRSRRLTTAIAQSKDATFLKRSVDNDRATLTGVLTGGPLAPADRDQAREGGRHLEGRRRDARGRVIGRPAA